MKTRFFSSVLRGQIHQLAELLEQQFAVALVKIAEPGQIDRHHADGTRHLRRAEQAPAALEQFAQVELQAAAHGAHGIRLVGVLVRHSLALVVHGILAADEILEIGGTDSRRILEQKQHILPFPVEIFRNVHRRNRKGERLARAVAFRQHLIKSLVDEIHLRLEMLVRHRFRRIRTTLGGPYVQHLVVEPGQQMAFAGERNLLAQIARHRPVDRHVREGRLPPAGRHVQIVHETAEILLHALETQAVAEHVGSQIRIERAECLRTRPLALQNAEEIGHLPESFAEMARRAAVHAAAHTIETLIQQIAQAPPGAVPCQAVEIVDMNIPVPVRGTFPGGIHLVEPVIRNHLARRIVDQPGIGIRRIGIGRNAPVRLPHILFHRLAAVHERIAVVHASHLLALQFVQEAVLDEIARRLEGSLLEKSQLDHILHLLHRDEILALQLFEHAGVNQGIIRLVRGMERLLDSLLNLVGLEVLAFPVTFDDKRHVVWRRMHPADTTIREFSPPSPWK